MKYLIFTACMLVFTLSTAIAVFAQSPTETGTVLPEAFLGNWEGEMLMYREGRVADTVVVQMTIAETDTANVWIWKTTYVSPDKPIVKDYLLKVDDAEKGIFILDEQNGILLREYLINSKFFSVFEVQGRFYASTYEVRDGQLIFEITYGKPFDEQEGVTSYAVSGMQRTVLKRVD